MLKLSDYATPCELNFCPGCGDFGIWSAFKKAAIEKNWTLENTAFVAGIGCHGHISNFIKLPAFEGLHGRALPLASGLKMVNHKLNVFVFTGDGDSLAEGGNHFIHTCRRNHDLTIILHDNALYGLTTGQTSPRSPKGFKSKSTPAGNPDEPLNPLALAITTGATFVARGYAGDIPNLKNLIIQANDHKGLAIIDVLQPCVTFNKLYTHRFFQENTYWLDSKYDPSNKIAAYNKALEWGVKQIPLGIIYQDRHRLSYEQEIVFLKNKALIAHEPKKRDISSLFVANR